VLEASAVRRVAEQSVAFRTLIIRNEQLILSEAQQCAACNTAHSVEARLSRMLLRCRDLTGGDHIELTQEYLADMLGAGRTSVTLVAGTLQQAGLIRYRRGHIQLLNIDGLRDSACECYETLKSRSERLLGNFCSP
jgi:hypothetical protein